MSTTFLFVDVKFVEIRDHISYFSGSINEEIFLPGFRYSLDYWDKSTFLDILGKSKYYSSPLGLKNIYYKN